MFLAVSNAQEIRFIPWFSRASDVLRIQLVCNMVSEQFSFNTLQHPSPKNYARVYLGQANNNNDDIIQGTHTKFHLFHISS